MNRRALITGAAALAAPIVVIIEIVFVRMPRAFFKLRRRWLLRQAERRMREAREADRRFHVAMRRAERAYGLCATPASCESTTS